MASYHFTTHIDVTASRDEVWAIVFDPQRLAECWSYLDGVDELTEGDATRLGARYELRMRTALPYRLQFTTEIVRIEPPVLLETVADGELRGRGRWTVHEGEVTRVTYEWLVQTTRPWMNVLAPVARPVFSWNHDMLMEDFAAGLATATDSRLVGGVEQRHAAGRTGVPAVPHRLTPRPRRSAGGSLSCRGRG